MTAEVRDAFDRLYREHGDRLWRSLLLFTGRPEIASDAAAEAFAQAIRRGDQIGARLLASGEDGFLWGCGFTMPYTEQDAAVFQAAFGG